jgi:hypothetical protein
VTMKKVCLWLILTTGFLRAADPFSGFWRLNPVAGETQSEVLHIESIRFEATRKGYLVKLESRTTKGPISTSMEWEVTGQDYPAPRLAAGTVMNCAKTGPNTLQVNVIRATRVVTSWAFKVSDDGRRMTFTIRAQSHDGGMTESTSSYELQPDR